MASVHRPLSPHLSIYKWQITMVLSILHRATGVALYGGSLLLVGWLCLAAYAPAHFATWHGYMISPMGRIVLLAWTLAFYFHFANGIRHLFWDMGKGFELNKARASGVFVVLFTLAATAASWAWVYHQMGQF